MTYANGPLARARVWSATYGITDTHRMNEAAEPGPRCG